MVGVEEMRLVDDEYHPFAALVGFGGERVDGLGDERRLVEPGCPAERGDDRGVEAPGADGGVGDVDDGVAAGVERGDGRPGGNGLAGADLSIKERAFALTTPASVKPGRYKPPDSVLAFLEAL